MWRLTKPVHSSWQIAGACAGVYMGICAAAQFDLRFFVTLGWLLTGIALVLFAVIRQQRWAIAVAIAGGMTVGLWRGASEHVQLSVYNQIVGKVDMIEGVVSEDVDIDEKGGLKLRLKQIAINEHTVGGTIWVSLSTNVSVQRSDKLVLRGKLSEGFGSFAATMYRPDIIKIQRPEPGDVALKVRDWFADAVRSAIPEPEASLGIGYLVGQRRSLPQELDEALRIAGLTHIVVASGYNLTILVRLARRLFEKVSKYLSVLSASTLVVAFIAVTGMSPSMSRAGLVAGLSLAAWYYGRSFHPLVLLPVAIATTTLINPSYAWGDVGWQLSFAAFAGVMILAPLGQAYFFGSKKPGIMRQIFGETIAATLATLPILLLHFGYMSNVALVANILILPLVPLAMLLTFIAGIGGLVALPFIGAPASTLLAYMVQTAQFFAGLPWAVTEIDINVWHVFVMYALLVGIAVYWQRATRYNLRAANIVE